MWENYYSVSTVDEALQLLTEHGERARIIAGGTDILIELDRGQRQGIDALVDISRVPELSNIDLADGVIDLGPLVTHNHIIADPRMTQYALPLAQACWEVGAPQIRNRATIAGNLITASPANDTITPLVAMDATITLASMRGERRVPIREFYTGLRKTVMQPDEMLTQISFPALGDTTRAMFYKLGLRRAQAISVVNAAVVLHMDGDTIVDAAITLGSVAPTILRVPDAESVLRERTLIPETIQEAAQRAATTPSPIDDVRGTAEYRTEMVRVLVSRMLRTLADGNPAPTWGEAPAMLWGQQVNGHAPKLSVAHNHGKASRIDATINGTRYSVETGQNTTLLDFLRDHIGLTGTKEGCAEGECGSCTVFLDGAAVMACMVPAPRAHNADVVTVEGLQQNGNLHPIQQAFIEEGAVQCGYCTPGFLMAGAKLLEEHPNPTRTQIQQSISGNLCRCTGYYKIVNAFEKAAGIAEEK
jgi:xanthine dehydrogenase iron-sulfur cluster and FAD-binding subunit A